MRLEHDSHTELTMHTGPFPSPGVGVPLTDVGRGRAADGDKGRLPAQSAVLRKDNDPTMRDFLLGHGTDRRISTKTLVKIRGYVWPRAGFGQGRSAITG